MEGELAKLRQELREEQHRREEAEELLRPQTFSAYLETCHSLSLAIQVATDRSLTTPGDTTNTTNPTNQIFPRRIILWDNFATA
ncbi:hypothetical protein CDEST_15508 [Colletotrichum destructivum]|uniref:Uncharacterized protein n=1 Tax=Colletotrichum destructivum TaxID=34406 RepID=A0AAX4J4H1_9PEZI|nr:hypothetical protein CDEST_15508 [Colletotrichum destructivum]